jgi:hypothetical protein
MTDQHYGSGHSAYDYEPTHNYHAQGYTPHYGGANDAAFPGEEYADDDQPVSSDFEGNVSSIPSANG